MANTYSNEEYEQFYINIINDLMKISVGIIYDNGLCGSKQMDKLENAKEIYNNIFDNLKRNKLIKMFNRMTSTPYYDTHSGHSYNEDHCYVFIDIYGNTKDFRLQINSRATYKILSRDMNNHWIFRKNVTEVMFNTQKPLPKEYVEKVLVNSSTIFSRYGSDALQIFGGQNIYDLEKLYHEEENTKRELINLGPKILKQKNTTIANSQMMN